MFSVSYAFPNNLFFQVTPDKILHLFHKFKETKCMNHIHNTVLKFTFFAQRFAWFCVWLDDKD